MDVFMIIRRNKTNVFLDAKENTLLRYLNIMIANISKNQMRYKEE